MPVHGYASKWVKATWGDNRKEFFIDFTVIIVSKGPVRGL
jgi:hypothetical protein